MERAKTLDLQKILAGKNLMQAHHQHSRKSSNCRTMKENIDAAKSELTMLEKKKDRHSKYACTFIQLCMHLYAFAVSS